MLLAPADQIGDVLDRAAAVIILALTLTLMRRIVRLGVDTTE
jgi:hypothetical protein